MEQNSFLNLFIIKQKVISIKKMLIIIKKKPSKLLIQLKNGGDKWYY